MAELKAKPATKITADAMNRLIMMSPNFWKGFDSGEGEYNYSF